MKIEEYDKLNNPVWYSLSEIHSGYLVGYGDTKFYDPEYCAFGGWKEPGTSLSFHLDSYALLSDSFFIIGEQPGLSGQLKINRQLICLQMVADAGIDVTIKDEITVLNNTHAEELYQLVNLVQPGYFKKKTALLGNYSGIFKNEKLVAVTGERMKMNGFTELSAVVTHPYHTGKGYAKQLLAYTANNTFRENKIPYLHVVEDNVPAISLYKQLGFRIRRSISFWHIIKKG